MHPPYSKPGFPALHYSPGVRSNSRSRSRWYYLTISCSTALLSFCFQSFPASGSFSTSQLFAIRWRKYFSISPSNEYSGLTSFRMDCFDLLAVQETLKNLLQHHNSRALTLQCSAFFLVLFSHPHMNTVKTIAFTIHTFVGKVMFPLFSTLFRFVKHFLPRTSVF